MKEINIEELKKIQLDILSVIDGFCREKGIKYSLGCGSMLGAARHKGYIPWDDDIDIYLLRNEFNKLVYLYPQAINHIELVSLERDSKWDRAYAKAYNNLTVLREGCNSHEIGVGIDVFPIDKVPENEEEWLDYDKKRRMYQRIYELKKSMIFRKGRPIWKYFFLPFTKTLLLPFSSRRIALYLDKYSQKYAKTDSCLVFECCQGIFQKRRFKRETLENIIDVHFEDRIFMGMSSYNDYLSNAYGDWRKLPPIEKQISHHIFKAWWK